METKSIWFDGEERTSFPHFSGEGHADVVIIGGGISGVTAAQLLSEKDRKVIVLEAHRLAESNTGRSTGNLYALVDTFMQDVKKKYDEDTVREIIESRLGALHFIEENIRKFHLECDFVRVPWIRFSAHPSMDDKVKEEYELLSRMGLQISWIDEELKPLEGRMGFKVEGQAQFNPYLYVSQLAQALSLQCSFYENSRVIEIEERDDAVVVKTSEGWIKAKHVMEATHTPLGISTLQTLMGPYREYGVATRFNGTLSPGIYWGYYQKDKVTSVRTYNKHGKTYLLAIGEPHKVGQGESLVGFEHLKEHATRIFHTGEPHYAWGGQHYRPADLLPYIGKKSFGNRYVATGFSTDGLIYGTLAAQIIAGEILGQNHPSAELYRSTRVAPVKSSTKFVQENVNVAKQYLADYLKSEELHEFSAGEGMVVKLEGHRLAISKNREGKVFTCSAICPHMGCVVHWNKGEESWDCPCHGSRFDQNGQVIEGPAFSGLKELSISDRQSAMKTKRGDLRIN